MRSLRRYFTALWYLVTFRIDKASEQLEMNPGVVQATYEEVIREKTARVHQYKDAIAALIAQQEKKRAKDEELTQDVERLEKLKAGALAKAKKRADQLAADGRSQEEIQHDEGFLKCQSAYRDFNNTLAEKLARIGEIEQDLEDYGGRIRDHKVRLQSLMRDLDKIKSEKTDAVADMITAKEEQDIADMISGIAEDGTAESLQRMRDLRTKAKANARISRELAGTETASQEAEFLEYARQTEADDEFSQLLFGAKETDERSARRADGDAPLPE